MIDKYEELWDKIKEDFPYEKIYIDFTYDRTGVEISIDITDGLLPLEYYDYDSWLTDMNIYENVIVTGEYYNDYEGYNVEKAEQIFFIKIKHLDHQKEIKNETL